MESAVVPTSRDVRAVLDAVTSAFARIPDDAWDRPAHRLAWDCRDTAAHLCDDLGFYALQLSGVCLVTRGYVKLAEPPPWRPGCPPNLFYPDPAGGTAAIVECLDAVGGLLVAVTATVPPERTAWHPWGDGDAPGFAAMGITEALAHAWDVLTALDHDTAGLAADPQLVVRVLTRLFPWARAEQVEAEPWAEFLRVTGRAPQSHQQTWRWDSSVREAYEFA